jgi:hypothetical protein
MSEAFEDLKKETRA